MEHIGPVTKLKELFKDRDKQAREFKDKYLRALAELENYRKRMEKEMEDMRRFARVDFLVQIIPVLDNLDRAMKEAGGNYDGFFQGIEIICRQLKETLRSMGMTEFSSTGEEFDPARHEAVGMIECDDKPDNSVVEEISKGYAVGGKVVKPARVIVARQKQGGNENAENNRN